MPLYKTLRHCHIRGIIPFTNAEALQQSITSKFLAHKAAKLGPRPVIRPSSPLPTLLTFTPTPVYTLGRREGPISQTLKPKQLAALTAPFYPSDYGVLIPEVVSTLRGGQITFHGPGQLVIYPVIDLRPMNLTPRKYVDLLEETTIRTLGRWGISGIRTRNPGAWVVEEGGEGCKEAHGNEDQEGEERKIAALGVHLRRNVTGYGVGLNVDTDLRWYERIVACGLVGKGVTSMEAEMQKRKEKIEEGNGEGKARDTRSAPLLGNRRSEDAVTTAKVAAAWAEEFAKGLLGEGGLVQPMSREELEKHVGAAAR